MYNEYRYWNEREFPTSEDGKYHGAHLGYLHKHMAGVDRVLDFGPGIGRTFTAYRGIGYVEGYDISHIYKDQAMKVARELGLTYVFTLNTSGDTAYLPYDTKWFDVAVACSVLMHQRPQKVVHVMRELARVAKKVVVMAWMDTVSPFDIPDEPPRMDSHCFHYNYPGICGARGWNIIDMKRFERQVFFTYANE